MIPTGMAAGLLRLSRSMFLRYTKRFGLQPVGLRLNGGQAEKLWSKVQVLGLMLAGALRQQGVSEEWCDVFPRLLTDAYTDEQLEAVIEFQGRKYLLIAGATVLPEMLTLPEANDRLRDNNATLAALRIRTTVLSIGDLFTDLMAAVRSLRAAEEYA